MIDSNIIVNYRYVITMPNRYKPYNLVVKDWTENKLDLIYNGKIGLLVSPYFFIKDNDEYMYCQLLLDIEGSESEFQAFEYSKQLVKTYPFLSMAYTGKSGFHLMSNFLVKVKRTTTFEIRHQMLDDLRLSSIVDKVSSIRNMPTIRIGSFGKRFAFPTNSKLTYNQFVRLRLGVKDFSNIMSKQQLVTYIKTFVLPSKVISQRSYRNLIS